MMYSKYLIVPLVVLMASCGRSKNVNLTGDSTKVKFDSASVDRDSTAAIKNEAPSAAYLIVPGKSIGNTRLNEDLDSVYNKLGRPDDGDAAMGASFSTWYAKHDTSGYQTDVYAHHNYDGKHDAISYVKIIRVTSPAFKTAEYLHNGLTLQDMAQHFKLDHVATFFKGTDSLKVYDDKQAGIAFEINNAGKCTGILVHLPGDDAMGYLSMHPKMQRADIKK